LIRREEMGREQLDRTKRFTDDGKLRGIISSAKFVPECDCDPEFEGFGQLFRVREKKDADVERELDVIEDEQVSKKRRVEFEASKIQGLDSRRDESSIVKMGKETMKRKRTQIVTLKIPNVEQRTNKKRRVQFADVT
jgi:hypothetical protein